MTENKKNILDEIAEFAKLRVKEAKEKKSFNELISEIEKIEFKQENFFFEKNLKKDDIAFICECKKASPSKGLIAPDFDYLKIAKEYEDAGASAISVLTEPKWFLGKNEYLKEIALNVKIPVLRKDFVVDDYMIAEAKILNASAVLLIVAILNDVKVLKKSIELCDSLGLSALVEAHDENEIKKAIDSGARIIGVNNRNLKNFTVNFENCKNLRSLVPDNIIFVAESGIKTHDDILELKKCGVNAVLIGETLMRAEDKKAAMKKLKE